jgi:hypothetical protein
MDFRKDKWAAAGILGGFLLCCLLLWIFRHQQTDTPQLATATSAALSSGTPGILVTVTNVQMAPTRTSKITNAQPAVMRIWEPPGWGEAVPGQPGPGYSLDLIDDIHTEALPTPK